MTVCSDWTREWLTFIKVSGSVRDRLGFGGEQIYLGEEVQLNIHKNIKKSKNDRKES